MRPFRVSLKCLQCQHQAYVLLQNSSESGHVAHKIKENEEKKTCPPPTPHPTYTKKDLTLTLPDTKKINVFQNLSK